MFGYVKPCVPELKVAEYELYRAVYCGLCREMGRVTGTLSRVTLSYDFTWLATVRMIICGTKPETKSFRCPAHPAKKRLCVISNPELSYAAAMSAALAYLKNSDDISDEKGAAHLKAILTALPLSCWRRRGERSVPDDALSELTLRMDELSQAEREKCDSLDETADLFGRVLEIAFSAGLSGTEEELSRKIGFHVGRFVYVCDAADDLAEDIRKKRYNPLAEGWGEYALDDSGKMSPMVSSALETSLPLELEALGEAIRPLCKAHPLTPVVDNTVYLGMPAEMKRILQNKTETKEPLI